MATSDEAIETCPFCGSLDTGVYYDSGRHYVSCECGAKGPIAETYEEAITKWNRRTNDGK